MIATTKPLRPAATRDLTSDSSHRKSAADRHDLQRLHQVQQLARWMDNSFRIPGTPIRFGWDSVIGFVPGFGDVITTATGGWIIREAYRAGAPKRTIARMLWNVAVDTTIGAIPLLGDLFDLYWKSNVRNAKLLEKHLRAR